MFLSPLLQLQKQRYTWKLRILNKNIRESKKYENWRDKIKKRDKHSCIQCKAKGIKLEVHHKKSFAQIVKENKIKSIREAMKCGELWSLKNGQTLCEICHTKTETYWKK